MNSRRINILSNAFIITSLIGIFAAIILVMILILNIIL